MNIDDASGTLFTFVLGLAVGAVVTFLFEPKSKEEVRSDVAEVMRGAAKHVATRGKSIKEARQSIRKLGKRSSTACKSRRGASL
jgi:gas vesicle protein